MSNQSPAAVFAGLRDQLFRGNLAALAPAFAGGPASGAGPEVVGVVMEFAATVASCLVFGLRDGSASFYVSTGGGAIGGQGQPAINAAAKKLVEVARPFAARFPLVDDYPLPAKGRVRFSILTVAGVRAAEADEAELSRGQGELLPLFAGAHQIITGFRLAQQRGPADESDYINCLLTALGRGNGKSVTLTIGSPPPDLKPLTADPADLKEIADNAFVRERLSTPKIIETLLHMAGFRPPEVPKTEGRIATKLVAHGGKSTTDVTFRVVKKGHGSVEVARVPPGS